jgi:hypothetical protein
MPTNLSFSPTGRPDVELCHEARGVADCLIWTGDFDVVGHRIID